MNDEALKHEHPQVSQTVGVNSQLAIEKAVRKAIDDGQLRGSRVVSGGDHAVGHQTGPRSQV